MTSLKKIDLSEKEELRVEIRQVKGRAFADFRVYAHVHAEEAKWPTGRGFLIPESQLPKFQEAVANLSIQPEKAVL